MLGFRVSGIGFRCLDPSIEPGKTLKNPGPGFLVESLGFRIQGF